MALVAVLASGASAQGALVVNGSFEEGSYTSAPFDTLTAVSTAITGWTVMTGSIDWIGSYWQASDGVRSLDLSGLTDGVIGVSTNLSTTPGQVYSLTFDLSGNPDFAGEKRLLVNVGSFPQQLFTFNASNSRPNMGWVSQSYTFTANSTSTALTFASGNVGSPYGPALDNVAVIAVPEPGSLAVWSLLVAVLGVSSWRAVGRRLRATAK
jgi:choice-of-anchor C domain-containing protein